MTDLTPDHPAVQAAARAALAAGWTCDTHEPLLWGECPDCTESHLRTARRALAAALSHLTADDLPAHRVRDIQVRTLRAAARAATYDEGGIPGGHYWNLDTVSAWLDGLADNIEGEGDA